jgi:S1-C subfamily serine protease
VDAVVARIWRKDSGETRIERSAVDDVLANPVALLRGVRLDPSAGPGIGLRGIRPGSVLHALGLVEGDRLLSINGQPLLGVEEGLAAYARLRTADVLHLEVQREGGTIELTVGVR